jgi:amino acid permease
LVLWATAELAGRLFGEGSPATQPTELVAIALRFATRLEDPAAAWPAAARQVLPGPLAFYFCLLLVLALVLSMTLGLWRAWRSLNDASPSSSEGGGAHGGE